MAAARAALGDEAVIEILTFENRADLHDLIPYFQR